MSLSTKTKQLVFLQHHCFYVNLLLCEPQLQDTPYYTSYRPVDFLHLY
jgi:hypothetical protein